GPTHIVEMVNLTIAYFDKTSGAKVFQQTLDQFFAPVASGPNFSDPDVIYDELAGRFVVGVLDFDLNAQTTSFDFAVSDSSNPPAETKGDGRTFTEMHRIALKAFSGGPPLLADYPRVGWNAAAYPFSFNMFNFAGTAFDHVQLLTIDRASVLDASPAFNFYRVD